MFDANFYLIVAASGLTGLGMVTVGGLSAWRGWLALKHKELGLAIQPGHEPTMVSTAGARIEIADLKERIRKLEAIAAGVDL